MRTPGPGATSSYDKNDKIPGSSYIYDSEGPAALSLGLIILPGQSVSGHLVRASFVSIIVNNPRMVHASNSSLIPL